VAQIARLEGVRNTLQERFTPTGTKRFTWRTIETAFKNRILTGAVINADFIELRKFLEEIKNTMLQRNYSVMAEHGSIKVNTAFNGEFVAGDKTAVKTIATKNRELFQTSDLHEWYTKYVVDTILASLEEFQKRDSGWALSRILDLTINVNRFNLLHAECHINITRKIMLKRAVVNIKSLNVFRMGSGRHFTSCGKASKKNE